MNLSASSNSPGSPEECLALQETIRRIEAENADLKGELGKAQFDKLNLTKERDLWREKYRCAKAERNRLRDALTEMEHEMLRGKERAGEGVQSLLEVCRKWRLTPQEYQQLDEAS